MDTTDRGFVKRFGMVLNQVCETLQHCHIVPGIPFISDCSSCSLFNCFYPFVALCAGACAQGVRASCETFMDEPVSFAMKGYKKREEKTRCARLCRKICLFFHYFGIICTTYAPTRALHTHGIARHIINGFNSKWPCPKKPFIGEPEHIGFAVRQRPDRSHARAN